MKPVKFFSFSLPFDMFCELKELGREMDYPVAGLIRNSLSHVLKDKKRRLEVLKGEHQEE